MSWIDKTGWSTGDTQNWKYTTTTTDTPLTIKMPKHQVKEQVAINSPIEPIGPTEVGIVHQGWLCPKCGRINAPWVSVCPCYMGNVQVTC